MQFKRKPKRMPIINIIPLIDVLVVLLIFYIATTVFKKPEPKINIVLPDSHNAKATQEAPPTILSVTEDSKMYLGDQPVEIDQLTELLKSKLAADPNFKVAMKADTKAPFGFIVKVMDAAKAAGMGDLPTFMNKDKAGAGAGQ